MMEKSWTRSRDSILAVLAGLVFTAVVGAVVPTTAQQRLDEMSLDRWKELREVERYQLNIAEKYYREKNFKVAMAEYEKFLTLYETSVGAPYAQLKWSLCLVELRKLNTAIKEGFQSVIDYWPDAPEAVAAQFYSGRAYKDMGEIRKAKKAYQVVLDDHAEHLAAVYATADLIDITTIDDDVKTRVKLWNRLTFDTKRDKQSSSICVRASQQLAAHEFQLANFESGVKALATTYPDDQLTAQVVNYLRAPISSLTADEKMKATGEKLTDQAVAWVRSRVPQASAGDEEKQVAVQCWYHMADLYAFSKRQDKVAATYDQLIKTFGATDATRQRIGDWYKSVGDYETAREQYGQFEDAIEGRNQIAYSYRQQENYDAAIAAYRNNVAADPENQAKWHGQVAATLRQARRFEEAVAVYTELLKSAADQTETWLWAIATTYREAGKYKEAIGFYRQCNNFPSNYTEMAACHRALKEYGEAVILYQQVAGGAEASAPWATLQIGYTQEQAGKKEAAIKAFQLVCKRYPKDRYASQAHAHLQNKYKISVTLGGAAEE